MFEMTPTILRNFFSKRSTRRYPRIARTPFEKARGAIHNDVSVCDFCGICAVKCPSRCIAVDRKNAAWRYDPFECIYCGICVDSCKSGSLSQETRYPCVAEDRVIVLLYGVPKKSVSQKKACEQSQ